MPATTRLTSGRWAAFIMPLRKRSEEVQVEEEAAWQKSVHFGYALINDGKYGDALGKLARHETTLMNAFTKTLQMLLLLQENRENSDPVMLEAVVLPAAA